MGSISSHPVASTTQTEGTVTDTQRCDVLVIGASPAGMQAAYAAAAGGAQVLLLDSAGIEEIGARQQPPPIAEAMLQGLHTEALAPRWLPDHTALELLVDARGAVRGAAGVRGSKEAPWRIEAGAVLIATGAALLMAAEAGAQLSGLEEGQGGLLMRADDLGGASSVDGLYAAGLAAWSPQPTGSGLPWGTQARALWSGQQAGAAAAAWAQSQPPAPAAGLRHAGVAGLSGGGQRPANPAAILAAVQAIVGGGSPAALDDAQAAEALGRLDALWQFLSKAAPAPLGARCATRAAAGRLAMARWQLRSLLARRASEAAHRDKEWVVSGGLDAVWVQTELRDARAALLPATRLGAFAR